MQVEGEMAGNMGTDSMWPTRQGEGGMEWEHERELASLICENRRDNLCEAVSVLLRFSSQVG